MLLSGWPGTIGTVQLFAYMTRLDSNLAYLIADLPAGVYPRLDPMESIGQFLPVGVARSASNDVISFYSRRTRLFLMAMPVDIDAEPQPVLLVATNRQAYEQLTLNRCEDLEIPSILANACALLKLAGTPEPDAASLFGFLMRAPENSAARHVLNAAGLSLSQGQMQTFADKLAKTPAAVERLRAHFPDDLIANHGFEDLLCWLKAREGDSSVEGSVRGFSTKLEIGPVFDKLDRLGTDGTFVSLPFVSARYIRRTVAPRYRACIVATARNEGLYLLDWLAYHRALGFNKFFLYSNDNTDGSDLLLNALSEVGEITWIRNIVQEGVRPQWKAYNHSLQILPYILDYEWSLFIDLDEYLCLNHEVFTDLNNYLSWCGSNSVDAIAFNWVISGSNGETKWRDEPVRKRFPMGPKIPDQHIKSMFRPQKFQASYPHHPIAFRGEDFIFCSPSMQKHSFHNEIGPALSIRPESDLAWVTHYFAKSYEEFLLKFARGRGDSLERSGLTFPGLEPDLIKSVVSDAPSSAFAATPHPLDDKVNAYRDYLLSLFGVSQAYDEVKRGFTERASAALRAAEAHPMFAAVGSEGRPLLEALCLHSGSGSRIDDCG